MVNMSGWISLFSGLKQRLRNQSSACAFAVGLGLCGLGLCGAQSVEARLNFNHAAYLCTNPSTEISKEAAQAFNDGWFLVCSNFRSRWGEALELLEKARAAHHPYARIALLYLRAKILDQNFPYAENQFDLIPILVGDDPVGVTLSALVIALSTDFLSKTPQNIDRLIQALDRAIAAGYVPAYYVKGRIFMMLNRPEAGLDLILKSAHKGNAIAKHHIAALTIHGLLDLTPNQAFDMLESAVKDGDYGSLQDLAYCYEKGFGTDQNLQKAIALYKLGMKKGDAGSAMALARLQLASAQPNYVDAFVALNFAYHNNKLEAANALGYLYMTGLGVKQNKVKGLYLMEQAANAGDITALENLIACYTFGNGVEPNPEKVQMYQNQLRRLNATQVAVQSSAELE